MLFFQFFNLICQGRLVYVILLVLSEQMAIIIVLILQLESNSISFYYYFYQIQINSLPSLRYTTKISYDSMCAHENNKLTLQLRLAPACSTLDEIFFFLTIYFPIKTE